MTVPSAKPIPVNQTMGSPAGRCFSCSIFILVAYGFELISEVLSDHFRNGVDGEG